MAIFFWCLLVSYLAFTVNTKGEFSCSQKVRILSCIQPYNMFLISSIKSWAHAHSCSKIFDSWIVSVLQGNGGGRVSLLLEFWSDKNLRSELSYIILGFISSAFSYQEALEYSITFSLCLIKYNMNWDGQRQQRDYGWGRAIPFVFWLVTWKLSWFNSIIYMLFFVQPWFSELKCFCYLYHIYI